MDKTDLGQEAAAIVTKGAPPLAVVGMSLFGIPLQEWVYLLTIIWLCVQVVTTLVRFYKDNKKKD